MTSRKAREALLWRYERLTVAIEALNHVAEAQHCDTIAAEVRRVALIERVRLVDEQGKVYREIANNEENEP